MAGGWRLEAVAAAFVLVCMLFSASEAQAYRNGLPSSLGGATLGQGQMIWISTGYPATSFGWSIALHPVFDLGLQADVVYSSPIVLGDSMIGGGGGAHGRVALTRGLISAALRFGVSAIAFGEGDGAAALIDLGSPAAELSMRLGQRIAVHAAIQVVIQYVTAPLIRYITTPSQVIGGFEARGGATVALRERLALTFSVSYGMTLWKAQESGQANLEVLAGVEYRLGLP